jgi:phosphohistidine phosphatase
MQLYVMRHSASHHHSPTGRDEDRQLTLEGRERARTVAHELRRREVYPARILSSPLRRCVETAEEVAEILTPELEIELRPELAPGAGSSHVLAELMNARAGRVLLVGHEPDMSQLTAGLLPSWSRRFDKAMLAALRIDVGESTGDRFAYPDAQLQFLIDPTELP